MSLKMLRETMAISISQDYIRVSLSCDDVNKALEEIEALEAENTDLKDSLDLLGIQIVLLMPHENPTRKILLDIIKNVKMKGDVRICRVCGCTALLACPGGCHWIERDLCSQCASLDEPDSAERKGIK